MTDTHGEEPIPLSVSVTAGPHSELTLAIAGEVDHVTVADLADAFDAALNRVPATLVVDLGNVEFCDSTGLAQLIRLNGLCHVVGIDLQVKPSPAVRKLVTVAGLDELLPLVNA